MKRLLFVLTIALVALSLNSAPVAAQATGATDVDITLEGIVVLHYFSNVDLTITSGALGGVLTGSTPPLSSVDEGTSAPLAGGMDFDLAIDPDEMTGTLNAVALTLENAWAVRSLGGATGNTRLAIAITDNTLTTGTADITITAGTVTDGTSTGASIDFPSTGLATPLSGDVELTLDMTDADEAGTYEDGVFTLTATLV